MTADPAGVLELIAEDDDRDWSAEDVADRRSADGSSPGRRRTMDPEGMAGLIEGLEDDESSNSADEACDVAVGGRQVDDAPATAAFSICAGGLKDLGDGGRGRGEITAAFSVYSEDGGKEITRVQSVATPFGRSMPSVLGPARAAPRAARSFGVEGESGQRHLEPAKREFSIAAEVYRKRTPSRGGFAAQMDKWGDSDEEWPEDSVAVGGHEATAGSPGLSLFRVGLDGRRPGSEVAERSGAAMVSSAAPRVSPVAASRWSVTPGSKLLGSLNLSAASTSQSPTAEKVGDRTVNAADALAGVTFGSTAGDSLYLSSVSSVSQ
jgi:hypothetical protein